MKFTIETNYDQRAMTAMVQGLRKTIRRKRSRRSHRFGWFAILLGTILALSTSEWNGKVLLTVLAVIIMAFTLVFEDRINAYVARKRGLPGLERSVTTFHENGYHSVTAMGESEFRYDRILRFVRVGDYLVFVLSPSHGQVYDLRTLTGGSIEEFCDFLSLLTEKQLEVA